MPENLVQKDGGETPPAAGAAVISNHSVGWKLWQITKILQAWLRFFAILAIIGGTIVYWDTLKAYYEKWTRPLASGETAASPDTEYFCPMDPGVVRDHPDKCPICGMPLSPRKKQKPGEQEPLPPGVFSRVQETPWRVAVAGIDTVAVGYQPLTREIVTVGYVEFDERKLRRISWRVSGRGKDRIDVQYVNFTDQPVAKGEPLALVYSPELMVTERNLLDAHRRGDHDLEGVCRERLELWGIEDDQIRKIVETGKPITRLAIRSPISGHVIRKYQKEGDYVQEGAQMYEVADVSTVWIEAQVYEDDIPFLKEGMAVSATVDAFPNHEFKGKLAFIHPHLDAGTRTLTVRFDLDNPHHQLRPAMYATFTLHVPVTQLNILPADASQEQKEKFDKGLVLVVPERAVIDTGSQKIVYREVKPGLYEGVEVQLGPRCGGFYPLVRGLRAGDKVLTAGSFLIDAETRLTAGASSAYFGASGGPQSVRRSAVTARSSTTRDDEDKVRASLARLSPQDRRLVEAQGYCPILGTRLGAMGQPLKILIKDQPVFLCCKGCVNQALANTKATLDKVADLKTKPKAGREKAKAPEVQP